MSHTTLVVGYNHVHVMYNHVHAAASRACTHLLSGQEGDIFTTPRCQVTTLDRRTEILPLTSAILHVSYPPLRIRTATYYKLSARIMLTLHAPLL